MRILKISTWNDSRLDEFSRRTDESFSEVKAEIKEVRAETKEGFAQMRDDMNQRFNTLTAFIAALIVAVVGAGIFG